MEETMQKLIVTAFAAVLAASSFASVAEAGYWHRGWHGGYHHGWHGHYHNGYWGPGAAVGLFGLGVLLGGAAAYHDDYYHGRCDIEAVRHRDSQGRIYYE